MRYAVEVVTGFAWLLGALAAVGLLGCKTGGAGGTRASAPGSAVPPAAPPLASAAAAAVQPLAVSPLARAGEQMNFRASMHGVEVAELALSIGDRSDWAGRASITARSILRSTAALAVVANVTEDVSTWIHPQTGANLRSHAVEIAGDRKSVFDTRYGGAALTFSINDAKGERVIEQAVDAEPRIVDINSMLFLLRAWEASPGATMVVQVVRASRVWRSVVRVVGYETVRIGLGTFPALRLDGRSSRLTRAGEVDKALSSRAFSIWISDDANRVPVMLIGRSGYGDVRLELIAYSAGSREQR